MKTNDPTICEPGEHSRIGASSAKRWMNCPGSIALCKSLGAKTTTTEYMAEGTAAHKLAEICLTQKRKPASFIGREIHVEGFVFTVNEEMSNAVNDYLKVCYETAYSPAAKRAGAKAFVEQKFSFGDDFGGTVDFAGIRPKDKTAVVADFKYGKGVEVEAEENPQLMIYALGLLGTLPNTAEIERVNLTIVQPRLDRELPYRAWIVPVQKLREWETDVLIPAVERVRASKGGIEDLCTGDHCRFCPALAQCPAQRAAAMEAARQEFDIIEADDKPHLPAPASLTGEQIARVLTFAEMLGHWADAVRAEAQARLEKAESVPGYKLVQKRSNRRWANEAEAEAALVSALGEDAAYKKTLITPAQAEKLGDFESFMMKPDNGLTVAPESDRRKAVEAKPGIEFVEDDLSDIL